MAGKSIKNLAICEARVKHLLQLKAKSLSVWNSQFNSKPPVNSDNSRTTEIRRILSKLNPKSPIFRNPLH